MRQYQNLYDLIIDDVRSSLPVIWVRTDRTPQEIGHAMFYAFGMLNSYARIDKNVFNVYHTHVRFVSLTHDIATGHVVHTWE